METKRCETCEGIGWVPADPSKTLDDLRADWDARMAAGQARFDARVERIKAERAAAEKTAGR